MSCHVTSIKSLSAFLHSCSMKCPWMRMSAFQTQQTLVVASWKSSNFPAPLQCSEPTRKHLGSRSASSYSSTPTPCFISIFLVLTPPCQALPGRELHNQCCKEPWYQAIILLLNKEINITCTVQLAPSIRSWELNCLCKQISDVIDRISATQPFFK